MSQSTADGQARFPGWRAVGLVLLIAIFFYPCLVVFWVRLVSGVIRSGWRRGFASPSHWGLFGPCYWFLVCAVYSVGTLVFFGPLLLAVVRSVRP